MSKLRDIFGHDRDELHGDDVVAYLTVAVRRNGAMSVEGCIENLEYSLAMLEAAKDSVRNHHDRQRVMNGGLIIPANETPLSRRS